MVKLLLFNYILYRQSGSNSQIVTNAIINYDPILNNTALSITFDYLNSITDPNTTYPVGNVTLPTAFTLISDSSIGGVPPGNLFVSTLLDETSTYVTGIIVHSTIIENG